MRASFVDFKWSALHIDNDIDSQWIRLPREAATPQLLLRWFVCHGVAVKPVTGLTRVGMIFM